LHNFLSRALTPILGQYAPAQTNIDFGKTFGINDPSLGDELLRGAAQYAPYMALPGGPLLQGTAFGATQSQNPITGAAIGGSLGAASELAPAAIGATKNLASGAMGAIQPQKYAQQLLSTLGGGNTLEGNAQSLAGDIQNAFANRVNQGNAQYAPVFDKYGNSPIYNELNNNSGNYQTFNPSDLNYDRNLNKLHDQFTSDPTLQNAHNLQSQLGSSIRKLQASDVKGNLSVGDRSTMQGYQDAQGALKGDINNFLTTQDPMAANQYNAATANWAQNVTPYLENSKIAQIAKGDVTNPDSITTLFKSPEPELRQIVNDVGPSANNKILYAELGKTQANLTPEKLTTAYNSLDNKGLGSYVTPDLAQQFEQLSGKTSARNMAQTAATGVLGAHFFGPFGAMAGAMGPTALRKLGQFVPNANLPLGNSLLGILKAGYTPAVNSGTANLINNQGGQ
jgi:hypothetical protein